MARCEHPLDHLGDRVNLAPVRSDLRARQAREVRNVTAAKDDNRVATSDAMSLEVSVASGPHIKGLTELVPAKPATDAHFSAVPVLWPCSCHRTNVPKAK